MEAGAVVVVGAELAGVVDPGELVVVAGGVAVVAGALTVGAGVVVVTPVTTPVLCVQGGALVTEAPAPLDATPLALAPVVDVPPTWLLLSPTWLLLVPTWLLLGATCEPGVVGATQGLAAAPLLAFWSGVPMLLCGALLILGEPMVMPGVPPVGVVFPALWAWPVVLGVLPVFVWPTAIPVARDKTAAKVKKRRSILLLSANVKKLLCSV